MIKWLSIAVLALAPALPAQVRAVYFLPMSNAFDQYLANRLGQAGLYEVVTDPQIADAVFTDSIGPGFEQRMLELYPPEVEEESGDEEKKADSGPSHPPAFRRGHGTIFLVDRRTRRVLFSVYEPPKNLTPHELDKTAEKIVQRLKKK